ncbi:MAG TPA: hypothetical protein VJ826_04080 [Candidatus Polarisedimenticolaceae bacterium]|nr:hypothetical protein [Candidatus Polarisedimenticolaceae bacterium]
MPARILGAFLACAVAAACSGRPPETAARTRPVDPPAAPASTAPRLSAEGDRIVLSWIETEAEGGPALRFASREGSGWSEARTVVADHLLAVDPTNVPGVMPLDGGGFAAHWSLNPSPSESHARALLVATSADGATWSAPRSPHERRLATDHAMASLVPAPGGGFGVAWLDGRAGEMSEYGEGGTGLYWADGTAAGFTPEVALDARVCDCCKTSAAWSSAGPIVAYRDRADDERRDISVVTRDGTTWAKPADVRNDGWVLTACPTNGPAIAASGAATAVAWFSGGGNEKAVRAAISRDGGKTLGPAVRVDGGDPVGRVEAAVLQDGSAAIVWLERKDNGAEVRVRRVSPDGTAEEPVTVATTSPSKKSGYPRVVTLGPREVLVAWIDATEAKTRIRASSVTLP